MRSNSSTNHKGPTKLFLSSALLLAGFSFLVTLSFHNLADGDLWAKLALGASLWERAPGGLSDHDIFAFTPTFPKYVDHEWGAGFVFFGCLKFLGPSSLMVVKMALAVGALGIALQVGRRLGAGLGALLLLAAPCALCVLPGYVPVIRSHAFSYFFFAITLLCLEALDEGRRWPAAVLIGMMGGWANMHGGWVAGFGIMMIYALLALLRGDRSGHRVIILVGCLAVTLINPYGYDYWRYLIPAVLHPRPNIIEWQPMPLLGIDAFIGFRVLFVLAVVILALGWRKAYSKKSLARILVLAITAFLAFRSRRHAPFFGVAALAFLGPYLEVALHRWRAALPKQFAKPDRFALGVFALYGALAAWVAATLLPQASLTVLAPVSSYPVREADILMRAGAKGNLAVPFSWGSYAAWRLHPHVKVSIDGRYEAAYPESTFLMNQIFFDRQGIHWDRLVLEFPVDYVILDLQSGALQPEDLRPYGFEMIWQKEKTSALLARSEKMEPLRNAARDLPPTSVDPLDPVIPRAWWHR